MKELIVAPPTIADFASLCEADCFLIGNSEITLRCVHSYSFEEMEEAVIKAHEMGKRLYIQCDKLFTEQELPMLHRVMERFQTMAIDGIICADVGVLSLAKKLMMLPRMIYAPQTLLVNAQDIQFYLDLGIQGVFLANEISLSSIHLILKETQGRVGIIAHGNVPMFYSRRPLIKNYFKQYDLDPSAALNNPNLYLKERNREDHMPIYQDDNGTVIDRGSQFVSVDYCKELFEAGMTYFLISLPYAKTQEIQLVLSYYVAAFLGKKNLQMEMMNAYPQHSFDTGFFFRKTQEAKEGGENS